MSYATEKLATDATLERIAEALEGGSSNGKCIPSVNSVTLDDDNVTATFSVDAYGSVMIKVSDSNVATASCSGANVVTVKAGLTAGTCTITCFSTGDTTHGTAVAFVTVTSTATGVYGVEWDGSALQTWTRTGAAAGFTDPVPAVNGGTGSSPFDDILPWSGMVKEERVGGTCVKIPKFYYKWTISGSSRKLEISATARDGFSVSPTHMNRGDGVGERSKVYVGRYHCATSTYKSTTGVKPQASQTRATFRTNIHALGSNIWQIDIATMITIWMLYLVEFANWDSEQTIGFGCGNNSATENMGYTDTMLYHTGTMQVNRVTYGVGTQYRWIEGLWDNVLDWYDGIYFATEKMYVIMNPANFSDTTGGTYAGDRPTESSAYIKSFKNSTVPGLEWFMYPDSHTGATEDTYVGDYCSYNASGVVLFGGGHYGQGRNLGLFCLDGSHAASYQSANIGSRLLELPAA